ncbi:MAG: choice-of-anchor D domain-containing protein [Bacteroidota bacterium]
MKKTLFLSIIGFLAYAISLQAQSYDLPSATFTFEGGNPFIVETQDVNPEGITFSADGSQMFIVGSARRRVYQYALSTPFDSRTAVFMTESPTLTQDFSPTDLSFSTDGLRMFVLGDQFNAVYQYNLGAAFDVTVVSLSTTFSVSGQETWPRGLTFSNDGLRMFVCGDAGDDVNQYDLTTAFELSSGVTFTTALSVNAQETDPEAIAFSSDGLRMFIAGLEGKDVTQYNLTTAFDLSTASSTSTSYSVATQEDNPLGLAFSDDGRKFFVVGDDGREVNQYELTTPFTISSGVSFSFQGGNPFPVDDEIFEPTGMTFSADGTQLYVIGNTDDDINQYTLITPFDLTTASFTNRLSVQVGTNRSLFDLSISTNGTQLFLTESENDEVLRYTLSTPFDITTATTNGSFSVNGQEVAVRGITFSNNGLKMYITGNDAGRSAPTVGRVHEYTLTTAFDLTTASFVQGLSVQNENAGPRDVTFADNGMQMFVLGDNSNREVFEYALTTAFDLSTASLVRDRSLSPEISSPQAFFFGSDQMFILDGNGKDINKYDLTPAPTPEIQVVTQPSDFGVIAVGSSRTQTYTIINTGSATLTITSISASGTIYSIQNAPMTIAAGASATFEITFTPPFENLFFEDIHIESDAVNTPVFTFQVSGIGGTIDPEISIFVTPSDKLENATSDTFTFTFVSDKPVPNDLFVNFLITGTATITQDYAIESGAVTFFGNTGMVVIPIGQMQTELVIRILDDNTFESDETIEVMITN